MAVVKASLEGVERKLKWADKHFETLHSEIARAREENPYRITFEPTTDPLGYKFYIHDLAPPDPDLGLIIGDCIHNLRACLDHLAYQLAILGQGRDLNEREARSVMFPIYSEPETFRDNRRRVQLLRPEEQERIEELQPYKAGDSSVWGPFPYVPALLPSSLEYLNNLEVIDKHRTVTPIWQVVDSGSSHPIRWPSCIGSGVRWGPLEEGGWLGDWTFDSDPPDLSGENLKEFFPLTITVHDPMTIGTATEVLDQLICAVAVVIRIFEPCFGEEASPPLPLKDVSFHPMSAYLRRIGQFQYLRR